MDGQGTKWRRNIAENFNQLSRAHDRYRRQTERRQHNIANVNVRNKRTSDIKYRSFIAISVREVFVNALRSIVSGAGTITAQTTSIFPQVCPTGFLFL